MVRFGATDIAKELESEDPPEEWREVGDTEEEVNSIIETSKKAKKAKKKVANKNPGNKDKEINSEGNDKGKGKGKKGVKPYLWLVIAAIIIIWALFSMTGNKGCETGQNKGEVCTSSYLKTLPAGVKVINTANALSEAEKYWVSAALDATDEAAARNIFRMVACTEELTKEQDAAEFADCDKEVYVVVSESAASEESVAGRMLSEKMGEPFQLAYKTSPPKTVTWKVN